MESKIPIITIHGIRRKENWFETLEKKMLDKSNTYDIKVYENKYWTIFTFLIPYFRNKKIQNFFDYYNTVYNEYDKTPHIICHSFGSYIFFKAIQKHKEIKFDKVILCGTILDPYLDWNDYIKTGQINKLLHEYGSKDDIVKFSSYLENGGNSGQEGFKNLHGKAKKQKYFSQKKLEEYGHSDYFYPIHINESWVPFLTESKSEYQSKILREEIFNRLQENIDFFELKNSNDIEVNSINYNARIDKEGNYYLDYTLKGIVDNKSGLDEFLFLSSADSNQEFDDLDFIAINNKGYKLHAEAIDHESFKAIVKISCDKTLEYREDFQINIKLIWKKAIVYRPGDTDHFAIKNIKTAKITLNFPYTLQKAIFFKIKNQEVIDNIKPQFTQEKDGTFTYRLDSYYNDENNIDGIIFYFEKKKDIKNNSKISFLEKSEEIQLKGKNIIFKKCSKEDIKNIYLLESNHIEFDNAVTESILYDRLKLFSDGFIIAIDKETNKIVGYIESVIINDWQFQTFDEIKNFARGYNVLGNTLYIIFIAVDPNFRNNKIATTLLSYIDKLAKLYSVDKIKLIAKSDYIGLYQKPDNNFSYIKELKDFLVNHKNVLMEKTVT